MSELIKHQTQLNSLISNLADITILDVLRLMMTEYFDVHKTTDWYKELDAEQKMLHDEIWHFVFSLISLTEDYAKLKEVA